MDGHQHNAVIGQGKACANSLVFCNFSDPAWYCARTKPKHEVLAASSLRSHLQLEVFNPQLRSIRSTIRGSVRVTEPLFPGYLFVHCVLRDHFSDVCHTSGVNSLVRFGLRIPQVPASMIEDLRLAFDASEMLDCCEPLMPGVAVTLASGPMHGMSATVLRVMPAQQRVQVLMDFLGRPTPVEVSRHELIVANATIADRLPRLAVS